MPRTVSNEATIDDPALIERVAIAIFEKTQGNTPERPTENGCG